MPRIYFTSFLVLFSFQILIAQTVSGKIVDSDTGEGIPHANIQVNDIKLVSNSEGGFVIPEKNATEESILTVSNLGYVSKKLTVADLKNQKFIIKLVHVVYEIEAVNVSKRPDPYAIMEKVNNNLQRNYKNDGPGSKDVLFYRTCNTLKPEKFILEMTKSKKMDKKGIQAANAELSALGSKMVSNPPLEFTDKLCNYYTIKKQGKENKPVLFSKLEMLKATKLSDENSSYTIDEMEAESMKIVNKHLDSTKYYRVKSGFFGSRDTISTSVNFNKKEKKKYVAKQLDSEKWNISNIIRDNSFLQNANLDFIRITSFYEYTYEGAVYSNDNEFLYVISFKPDHRKAKYKGKLYISEKDYAVVRAEYDLDEGKVMFGLNLKFLLGIKFSQNVSKGTIIFKERPDKSGYYLQYACREEGQYIYASRPFKFIEQTSGKKDVVAFDLEIEFNSKDKTEFLNVSHEEITQANFDNINEKDFSYIKLKRYDPKIWKDHISIEPLEEMKNYKLLN